MMYWLLVMGDMVFNNSLNFPAVFSCILISLSFKLSDVKLRCHQGCHEITQNLLPRSDNLFAPLECRLNSL